MSDDEAQEAEPVDPHEMLAALLKISPEDAAEVRAEATEKADDN